MGQARRREGRMVRVRRWGAIKARRRRTHPFHRESRPGTSPAMRVGGRRGADGCARAPSPRNSCTRDLTSSAAPPSPQAARGPAALYALQPPLPPPRAPLPLLPRGSPPPPRAPLPPATLVGAAGASATMRAAQTRRPGEAPYQAPRRAWGRAARVLCRTGERAGRCMHTPRRWSRAPAPPTSSTTSTTTSSTRTTATAWVVRAVPAAAGSGRRRGVVA